MGDKHSCYFDLLLYDILQLSLIHICESVPREVHVGDEIISGCVNLTGLIKIETSKEFGESTVSKLLDLVENSSMKTSRSENFITRFAKYYTDVYKRQAIYCSGQQMKMTGRMDVCVYL